MSLAAGRADSVEKLARIAPSGYALVKVSASKASRPMRGIMTIPPRSVAKDYRAPRQATLVVIEFSAA